MPDTKFLGDRKDADRFLEPHGCFYLLTPNPRSLKAGDFTVTRGLDAGSSFGSSGNGNILTV